MVWMEFAGRVMLAALFAAGVWQKLTAPAVVQALLAGMGWPEWLIWPALAFNAVLAVGLVVGHRLRVLALAGAAYCMVTSVFHLIPDDPWQLSILVKNWAIAGGLLVLAARA